MPARYRIFAGRLAEALRLLRESAHLETDRGLYLSLAELERRGAWTEGEMGPLTRYELRCFSQNGEDGVIAEILARIGVSERFFVEFGIESGREGNCVYLADVCGWRGLFIEADPGDFGRLEAKYRRSPRVQTLEAMVTPENIERVLQDASVPAEPDVLSIDVDSQDYWIWEAISSFRPRLVVIEYNGSVSGQGALTQPRGNGAPWDGSNYMGASLDALERLAASKGYVLVHTELTGLNAFFVREDLASGRFPTNEEVPRRTLPNYFLRGVAHPPDPSRRPYLDLETGRLVEPRP
jgi:hypothetical protein